MKKVDPETKIDLAVVSPEVNREDVEEVVIDKTLRPHKLKEVIGREKVKKRLEILIAAAKKRKEPVDHVLLYGPPGLGKTMFANVVANEIGHRIYITSGPAIGSKGDLASLLTGLEENDVLFIDEIHRLRREVEEFLYPALEEFRLDLTIGKGPSAKVIRLDLAPFTLVGATTRVGLLSGPLRDRFGLVQRLEFYDEKELVDILLRAAKMLELELEPKAAEVIAKRSRGTARVALRLLRRARDYADVNGDEEGLMMCGKDSPEGLGDSGRGAKGRGGDEKSRGSSNVRQTGKPVLTEAIAEKAMEIDEIDPLGLDPLGREILTVLIKHYRGGPVGIETLAAAISEEVDTLTDVYEPFLLKSGLIKRTPRGRIATERAYSHLGLV